MSFAILVAHHLSPATLAIGFAVVLVLSLVAAEERELSRNPAPESDAPQD